MMSTTSHTHSNLRGGSTYIPDFPFIYAYDPENEGNLTFEIVETNISGLEVEVTNIYDNYTPTFDS